MLSRHVQPGGLRNDFPPWVSEKARKILKSRFKLWSALYKHVDNNGPMKPLKVIKHAYQSEYNGGKWGLDKSTENYLKICVQASTSLESKYICRLFDGLVANSWIYDKSHFTIMPYVTQFREKHGRDPTRREQIRQRAYENKLSDYVLTLSLDWLKALEDERRAMMNIGEEVGLRAETSH